MSGTFDSHPSFKPKYKMTPNFPENAEVARTTEGLLCFCILHHPPPGAVFALDQEITLVGHDVTISYCHDFRMHNEPMSWCYDVRCHDGLMS